MEALIILLVLVVVVLVWWFSPAQKAKRALRNAPQVPIAQFTAGGYHKIVGRLVLQDESLTAPLSGRTCAVYEVLVEEAYQSNNSTRWRTVIHEVRTVPFVLDDGTGQARVEAEHAKLVIDRDQHSRSGTFDDPTPTEQEYLDTHGEEGQGWFFNRTLRYREGVLEPGEEVAVLGSGLPDGQGLKVAPMGDKPMYVTDDASLLL